MRELAPHEAADTPSAVHPTFRLRLEKIRLQALAALGTPGSTEDLARVAAETAAIGSRGAGGTRLALSLRLTRLEEELLWVATAAACDRLFLPSLKLLADDPEPRGVTLDVLARLVAADEGELRRLALDLTPAHALFRFGVLAGEPTSLVTRRAFIVTPRVVRHLAGFDELPAELVGSCRVAQPPKDGLYDEDQQSALARLHQLSAGGDALTALLVGAPGTGRASAVAAAADRPALVLDAAKLVGQNVPELLIAFRRECLLTDCVPAIRVGALSVADQAAVARALREQRGVTLIADDHDLGLDHVASVDWPVPNATTRVALWRREVPTLPPCDAESLGHRYRMGASAIAQAAATGTRLSRARRVAHPELVDLCGGARTGTAERMSGLAVPVEVKDSWNDIVLPSDVREDVESLIARVKHAPLVLDRWGFRRKIARGAGVAALLSGPPGTGKTMLAGLIARELGLELFQVDLSRIVSKWIGETEKQLARLFDAADAGHAMLLFDEADSLFAKRTDVKGANDRYANLEVNYLLQRVEAFGGVAVLTTNLDASIDPALRRRLAAHIQFMPPDRKERAELWGRMIPMAALAKGTGDFHFDALAREFSAMTGANIRNAVLRAAFLAASDGTMLSQSHLHKAARSEYRAMGRVLGDA
jgi:AAA+ superfamily predicted ATPase